VISLLTPIYEAQLASIRASRVKAMDETPIKAGRSGHGKMHTGYFWPIYGQLDEVCFPFHSSRSADFVCQALGLKPLANAVLLWKQHFAANPMHSDIYDSLILQPTSQGRIDG